MKNPPDFVMYVVMIRLPHENTFGPWWQKSVDGPKAEGYANRSSAAKELRCCQALYGKKNCYVQMYGPIS